MGSPVANLLAMHGSDRRRKRVVKSSAGISVSRDVVSWHDLLIGDVVGTGQFGLVRLTKNKRTADVYALKVYSTPVYGQKLRDVHVTRKN